MHAVFTIVLDPSDAQRQLATSFAKGATMQCVESIKKKLEEHHQVNVIITRTPGSSSSHESHAQMSNRLKADLYIHLSFFQETSVKPHWYIYHHSYGNELYAALHTTIPFWSYETAHHAAYAQTINVAHRVYTALQQVAGTEYHVVAQQGVPCAPLLGITAPALMLDIGLHAAHTWQQCVAPLCSALGTIIAAHTSS
jgi:N-acetylmuramoyl-L-alanine amidase